MATDRNSSFDERDMRKVAGYDMTTDAALQVYETAGIRPEDLDVVELHDCFTSNELITYEALGLTLEGTAERFIVDGDNTYGGRIVTNPSGGRLSRGAAALWDLAQDKAAASLRTYEAEARASVMEAKTALATAEAQRDAMRVERDKAQVELAQARGQVSALHQQLAAEIATREMLEAQLTKVQSDIAAHRQA
jgi:hypothetical protein